MTKSKLSPDESETRPENSGRLLTPRSLAFGLLGVFMMSGLAGYHNDVLGGSLMIGTHIPGGAFAYFIFIGLVWNGLWILMGKRRMALDTREIAVVMAMTLLACYPPTEGLFTYFFRVIMLPWYYLQNQAHWIEHGLLSDNILPRWLFPEPWPGLGQTAPGYDRVYHGLFTGLASGNNTVPLWELPLGAWTKPLMVWGPLFGTLSLVVISLQFIVHRQWAEHEQLPYPIAQVARGFCQTENGGRGVPSIFANRLFWYGFVPVAVFLTVTMLSAWYPESVPDPRVLFPSFKSWNLPVSTLIPAFRKVPNVWTLDWQALSFTIVGISYFIGSDTAFTMGLTTPLLGLAGILFINATGVPMEHAYTSSSRFGAGLGLCVMLAFTGRTYYRAVFREALAGLLRRAKRAGADGEKPAAQSSSPSPPPPPAYAVTAARVFLIALAAFWIILAWVCGSWVMAGLYTLFMLIMYVMLSRVLCECGIPFIQPGYLVGDMLVRIFGPAAIGPRPLTFLLWGTGIFQQDPRECLMPYVATALKNADDAGVRLRKFFWLVCVVVLLAIVIAFFATFHTTYNFNPMSKAWAAKDPPTMHFDAAARYFTAMKSSGVFTRSAASGPLARLALISPAPMEFRFFLFGIAAMVGLSFLRFKFTRFPIHPVILVMAGSYPASLTWYSFLCGWFVKIIIVRFGGGTVYRRLKPLFVGIIAGELFMVGVSVLLNFAHYFIYGSRPPVNVGIMPW
ncbi:MAG: hypothetical protein FWG05_02270 [Kiritimatiellaeota bacterium]|nr:hypothetical protein [Kiritimatiellota bacterium]